MGSDGLGSTRADVESSLILEEEVEEDFFFSNHVHILFT